MNMLFSQRPFLICLGAPNYDSMSGKYYARFSVKDTDNSDSYLRQAYRLFTLHTDGTFVDEPTDWLLMMKMVEAKCSRRRIKIIASRRLERA